MKYAIKDINKALNHLDTVLKVAIVDLTVDDMGRLKLSAFDSGGRHTVITVYRNADDVTGTLMPEITETKRL